MQSTYPVREMIKRGWIEQTDAAMLRVQLARFFEKQTPDEIPGFARAAKKTAGETSPHSVRGCIVSANCSFD